MRNGMANTSMCTLANGDGKVKIIRRGTGAAFGNEELTVKEGDNKYVFRVE